MEPTVTAISGTSCGWAMRGRDGYDYPHGIAARKRVTNACEIFNGDFCYRHARLAVERSIEQAIEDERGC